MLLKIFYFSNSAKHDKYMSSSHHSQSGLNYMEGNIHDAMANSSHLLSMPCLFIIFLFITLLKYKYGITFYNCLQSNEQRPQKIMATVESLTFGLFKELMINLGQLLTSYFFGQFGYKYSGF